MSLLTETNKSCGNQSIENELEPLLLELNQLNWKIMIYDLKL